MKLKVTQQHIDKGVIYDGHSCPIALALSEAIKEKWSVDIGRSFAEFEQSEDGDTTSFWLPLEAQAFVQEFDQGRKVKPFEFELDIPTEILKP